MSENKIKRHIGDSHFDLSPQQSKKMVQLLREDVIALLVLCSRLRDVLSEYMAKDTDYNNNTRYVTASAVLRETAEMID